MNRTSKIYAYEFHKMFWKFYETEHSNVVNKIPMYTEAPANDANFIENVQLECMQIAMKPHEILPLMPVLHGGF